MGRSVRFYESIGFRVIHGGSDSDFTTFRLGVQALNLTTESRAGSGFWGRLIFYVGHVDRFHATVIDAGHEPESAPADAPWGERFFHLDDPDGHQLSFARPIDRRLSR